MEKKAVIATYERDTRNYHRYLIDEGQGVTGTLYLPKSETVPEVLEIRLQIKTGSRPEGDA